MIQSIENLAGVAYYMYKEMPLIIRRNKINARYLDIPARKTGSISFNTIPNGILVLRAIHII